VNREAIRTRLRVRQTAPAPLDSRAKNLPQLFDTVGRICPVQHSVTIWTDRHQIGSGVNCFLLAFRGERTDMMHVYESFANGSVSFPEVQITH
jgi:hypothetical protein